MAEGPQGVAPEAQAAVPREVRGAVHPAVLRRRIEADHAAAQRRDAQELLPHDLHPRRQAGQREAPVGGADEHQRADLRAPGRQVGRLQHAGAPDQLPAPEALPDLAQQGHRIPAGADHDRAPQPAAVPRYLQEDALSLRWRGRRRPGPRAPLLQQHRGGYPQQLQPVLLGDAAAGIRRDRLHLHQLPLAPGGPGQGAPGGGLARRKLLWRVLRDGVPPHECRVEVPDGP